MSPQERDADPNSAAQTSAPLSQTSGPLSLDPGAPPRKPRSGVKFLVAAACVILLVRRLCDPSRPSRAIFVRNWDFLYGIGSGVYEMARFEHRAVWQNQSVEEVSKSNEGLSTVVQPLISEDQTFDIAVTVWQLRSEEERREVQVQAAEWKRQVFEGPVLDDQLMDYMESYTLRQKAIYSDIAFRGLKLGDKNVNTDIELRIPTAVFANPSSQPMNANDLRASFVLIP
ncbi:hypothetical protein C8J56DRAFT_865725 [Mycena floridula]|nr:hypothetical protein C8J56DRAFT_865725 [Mycena floridula]